MASNESASSVTDPLRDLVVGVDGSAASATAFEWACRQPIDGRVTAVHAFPPTTELFAAAAQVDLDHARSQHMSQLDNEWAVRPADCDVQLFTEFADDQPASALERIAKAGDGRVLVIGHQGHGGWSDHHVGDVASRLLHHTQVPVVMTTTDTTTVSLDRPIVLCVHGAVGPDSAPVAFAAEAARARELPLHLLTVSHPHAVAPGLGQGTEQFLQDLATANDAASELGESMRAQSPGLEVTQEVLQGHPTKALASAIDEFGPGLVVIGNHHHGTLLSMVTDSVLRHLPARVKCPVAAVPTE